MSAAIVNGAPMTILLGIQDNSIRAVLPEPEALPTHLPLWYTFAQKGPSTRQLAVGSALTQLYGIDSFDPRQKFATHATPFIGLTNANANAMIVERLIPDDAGPEASIRVVADVLPTKLPVYKRNPDGSFVLDSHGQRVQDGSSTVDSYQVKFLVQEIAAGTYGQATQSQGDQVDSVSGAQSLRYPLFDMKAPSQGSDGNNSGITISAPTTNSSTPLNPALIANEAAYPYRFAIKRRANAKSTGVAVSSLYGELAVDLVLKPNTYDATTADVYAGTALISKYQDLESPGMVPVYGPFGDLHLYEGNIDTLHKLFYAAEFAVGDHFSDFTGEGESEAYRFNIFGGTTSTGVPYHTYSIVTNDAAAVRFTENTTVYAQGGSDGTMNDEVFAELVSRRVKDYANINSPMLDDARNPESIIYDSGFPLETKYDLMSFMAIRKDVAVIVATAVAGQPPLTASQDSSMAVALKTKAALYPESEYYGTPVTRCAIVGRSGILKNSLYTKRVPATIEILDKMSKYMGAANGQWKKAYSFDQAEQNKVKLLTQLNASFTPNSVKNKDWSNGLIWSEAYERRGDYFPAFKTVYENDTSVLNSLITMEACVELTKIGLRTRRKFSGRSDLSRAQFAKEVSEDIEAQCLNKFDDRFIIIPEIYFTAADEARGFSYQIAIKIGAPNMITVGTLHLEAYRIEDLAK